MTEVLLFVGAPFSGKTLFYEQNLKDHYARISAAEVFASDPNANLRIVIQKIAALLKTNNKVVIDDENSERQTRLSFINGITKKMPSAIYSCFQFIPSGGTAQLHVCKEWARGRLFLEALLRPHQCTMNSHLRQVNYHFTSSRIESHSTNIKDLSLDWDQFKQFKKFVSPLVCFTSHKLTTPVLLLQWEGMVETIERNKVLKRGVCRAVQKWTVANSDGNIVVLFETEGGGGSVQQDELMLLQTLLETVPNCPPIHYIVAKDSVDFGRPPNGGLVVWIGYLFAASVHNKSSLYVHHSRHHQGCAERLSMRNTSAKRLFSQPHTVNTVHYSEHEAHHILQNTTYINLNSFSAACSSSPTASPLLRTLPLFALAEHLEDSQDGSALCAVWNSSDGRLEWKVEEEAATGAQIRHISADDGSGRVLGMVYKKFECLKRSQEEWWKRLSVVTETSVKFCSEDEEEKEQIGGNNSEKANQSGNDLPQEKSAEVGIDLSTLDPIQPATEVESSVVKSNSNPSLSVNRSLPSWMMESSQDSNGSNSQISNDQSKCESKRSKARYRMTESELLKTAMEYLKEAEVLHSVNEQEQHSELPVVGEWKALEQEDEVNLRLSDHEIDLPSNTSATITDHSREKSTDINLVKYRDTQLHSDSLLDELFM